MELKDKKIDFDNVWKEGQYLALNEKEINERYNNFFANDFHKDEIIRLHQIAMKHNFLLFNENKDVEYNKE